MSSPSAQELFDANLKQYGRERLGKLPEETLRELLKLMRAATDECRADDESAPPEPADGAARIAELLNLKEARAKEAKAAAAAIEAAREAHALGDEPSVFAKLPSVSVIAFNILKLQRCTAGTPSMWQQLMAEMAQHDVVLLTEVPASDAAYKERVLWFLSVLNKLSKTDSNDAPWTHVVSEPANVVSVKPDSDEEDADEDDSAKCKVRAKPGGNKEVHVCFAKAPVAIKKHWTWKEATNADGGCVPLDWAPLTVALEVGHVRSLPAPTMLVTMVHMPPAARRQNRDEQLKALLRSYASRARGEYGYAMTKQGAKESGKRAVHLVAGDFNCYPGEKDKEKSEVYGLTAAGFATPLIGSQAATSAGRNAYDNFLIDVDAWAEIEKGFKDGSCEVTRAVHPLAMPRKGKTKGLSDHHPISFEVRDRVLVD